MSDAASSWSDKDARIAELEAALVARDTLIDTLRFQLAQLRRMTFGQSSEKLSAQIEQLELTLEELEGEAAVADARKDTSAGRSERPSSVRTLPPHLPRAEQRIEPEAGHCNCPDCGGTLRSLGEDSDEMLDVLPVQWRVIRTIRPKYSCRSCEKIVQAPAPVKAIARGKATFATLAHVVVSKFDHHLPLYRQAEMMAAQGLDIDRSTLAGWAGQAAHLLDPIVSRIREEGLKAAKIHSDDTPVPMLMPGKGKTAQGRLWTYVVDDRASGSTAAAMVWYRFTPDRSGIHPQTELKNFTGLLQADGYAGYEKLYADNRIQEVACWAHLWMPPLLQGLSGSVWQDPRLRSSIRPVAAKRPAPPALMVNPQASSQSRLTSSKLDAPNGSMPAPVRPVLPSYSERSSHPRRPYYGRTRFTFRPLVALDYRKSRHSAAEPKQPSPSCSQWPQSRRWLVADRATALTKANSALASA